MTLVMKLSLFSPERKLLESVDVQEVTLTGSEGQIQILPGHASMVGTLETGIFSYHATSGDKAIGVISSGFFEIKDDHLTVMAETVEFSNEIDVSRAKQAQQLAEQTLRESDLSEEKFKKYELKLQRALIRQHVGAA